MSVKDFSQLSDDELMDLDLSEYEGDGSSETENAEADDSESSAEEEIAAADVANETNSSESANQEEQSTETDLSSSGSEDEGSGDEGDGDRGFEGLGDDAFMNFDPASKTKTKPEGGSAEAASAENSAATKEDAVAEKTEQVTSQASSDTTIDYKSAYQRIMAPFKANGRMIEPKSEDEVIQLMQMGANYTRRMQELSSVRKQITMLENNGLLDEEKLSFLIDLDKKNPEAIKKLLKDSGIDPLEIDTDSPTNYTAGTHKVTDDEMRFRNSLETVTALPEGRETIGLINNTWDQASKDVLWNSPEIMGVVHEQKINGVYDRICAEIERQRVLGQIPANIPFIQAYKAVGDYLGNQGAFNDIYGTNQPVGTPSQSSSTVVQQRPPGKTPVATRVAAPKQEVTNSRQVASVAGTRNTSSQSTEKMSNLALLNDDEFMRTFAGRV